MHIKGILFAVLIGAAVPGQAQQTTCTTIGNTINCNTQGQLQLANPSYSILNQGPSVMDQVERSQAAADAHNRSVTEAGMAEVWKRCRMRWNDAIEKRDFELADALAKGCPASPQR